MPQASDKPRDLDTALMNQSENHPTKTTKEVDPEPTPVSIDALLHEKQALQDDLANRETTIHSLQTTVHEMKRELKIMSADVDAIVEEKEILLEELEELRKRKPGDCAACVDLQAQIRKLADETTTLQNQIQAIDAERATLKQSLAVKEQRIQDTTARAQDLERRLDNDKKEYEKAVADRDLSIDSFQKKIHELKREVNVLTDDYDSVAEEKHEIEEKLDQVQTQLVNLEDELAAMDQVVADLKAEIEKLKIRNEQLLMTQEEERVQAAQVEADLRGEVNKQTETISTIVLELTELKTIDASRVLALNESESKVVELLKNQEKLEAGIEMLETDKAAQATAIESMEKNVQALELDNSAKVLEIRKYETLVSEYEEKLAASTCQLEDEKKLHAAKIDVIKIMESDLNESKSIQATQAIALVEAQATIEILSQREASLAKSLEASQAEAAGLTSTIDTVQFELKKSKQEVEDHLRTLKDSELKIAALIEAGAELNSKYEALQTEKSQQDTTISNLERELKASQEAEAIGALELKGLLAKVALLHESEAALSTRFQVVQDEKSELESSHTAVVDAIQSERDMWEEKYNQLVKAKSEHEENATRHVDELTAKWATEVAKLEALQSTHDQVVALHGEKSQIERELQAALATLTTEKELIAEKLKQMASEKAANDELWTSRVQELTLRFEAQVAKTEKLDATVAKHVAKVKSSKEKTATMAKDRDEWASKLKALESARKEQEGEWKNQEAQYLAQVDELTARLEAATGQIQLIQQSHDTVRSRNVTLSRSLATTSTKGKYWNPMIHVACLFAGIAFGMKAFAK